MTAKQHPARLLVGLFNDSDLSAVLHAARIGLADEDVCLSVGMGTGITAPRMRAVQELLHGFAERNRAALIAEGHYQYELSQSDIEGSES